MSKMTYFCSGISQKWVFAFMGFMASVCAFAMRMCLPLTITKMVKHVGHANEFHDETCPSPNVTMSASFHGNSSVVLDSGTFDWSEYTQGIILGSFYWGYVFSHIPGGILAERFGGKHTLGFGMFATAVCTILTPLSISWSGTTGLIWLRIVMGLFEGITQPALTVMLANWIPVEERSKISSFVFLGVILGIQLTTMSLGPLLQLAGWPAVYYAIGALGIVWYLFWLVLCYNSPKEHPFIGKREAEELIAKLKDHTHDDAPPVPWRHLLSSVPFWALVVGTVGRDWAGYTFMSDMPKYTMGVLKFTIEENGLLYLLINITFFVSGMLLSWLTDWLIERNYASRTNARKLMATISMAVHAVLMILSSYAGCDKTQYMIITCISMIACAAGFPGVKANVLDLSSNYAGTIMAISHGISGLCGIGGPYVVGILVPNQTLSEWRMVYWIVFVVLIVSNIVFVIFGSGDVQDWNDPNFDRKKKKDVELKEVEKLLTVDKIQIVASKGNVTN